jgi:hypothetical protein
MRNRVRNGCFANFGHLKSRRFRKLARLMLAAAPVAAAVSFHTGRAMGGVNYTGVTDTWTGTVGDGNWGTSGNWTTTNAGGIPLNSDSLVFGGAQAGTITDNIGDGTYGFEQIDGITFNGIAGSNGYTLNAGTFSILNGSNTVTVTNTIYLSGQDAATAANINGITTGITNTLATVNQTVNANVALDWGYHTFGSVSGSTLALNGSLTAWSPNTTASPAPLIGGLAYFVTTPTTVGTVTTPVGVLSSTSLTADQSTGTPGLISNLEGAGLTANAGGTFTGLATVSNGVIVPYTYAAANIVPAAATIGQSTSPTAAQNIELTAVTAGSYPINTANGNIDYINTITLSTNVAGQTLTIESNTGGTLDLGSINGVGGIYLPNAPGKQPLTIGGGAG